MTAFLAFYREALDHIISTNRAGQAFTEVYAQILLRKILTPFPTGYVNLQSPAGAGINVVAHNYDGDVYASDEARMLAEMGDASFGLGNVHRDDFAYCDADPIWNWATQADPVGHRPTSAFCEKNMGIIRHLFDLWRGDDPFVQSLFVRWATQ